MPDWLTEFPRLSNIREIQKAIDRTFKDFARAYGDEIETFFTPFLKFLVWTERLFMATPWWLILALIAGLAYLASRRIALAVAVVATMVFIGMFGMWDNAMRTLSFILVCTAICVVIGIPVGVAMALNDRVRAGVTPILDVLQTMPSFVYLIPVVILLGIGKVPGAIAVIAYAIAPVIRFTDLGIRLVDKEIVEASEAFGASPTRTLFQVQIPLAMPNIMAGVNQTIMMALAMVVIASMVGVRGLGMPVLQAVTNQYFAKGLLNGIAVVILAVMFDRITRAYIERTNPQRDD